MSRKNPNNNSVNRIMKKTAIILLWLLLWQLTAVFIDNEILFVGPIQVLSSLFRNMADKDFIRIAGYSFARIGLGFILAFITGIVLGTLAYRNRFIEELLAPVMAALKSVPVASFVVLLLIWAGSDLLSFYISFLVILPNIYVNSIAGLESADKKLLEMAEVFNISGINKFMYIYRHALMPYLMSSLKISLGMSWKSGVAAEVIGIPAHSIGERVYMSKIYLDTAGLFSWTFIVIILSFLFEKSVLFLLRRFGEWKPRPFCAAVSGRYAENDGVRRMKPDSATDIVFKDVCKAYGEQKVIDGFSYTIKPGGKYCLMAPSGAGKTTLLKLMSRIEKPDSGELEGCPAAIGMVFQEDRLCEEYDAVSNIMLAAGQTSGMRFKGGEEKGRMPDMIRKEALRILPEDCLEKPAGELSGGMKRRLAILRAMLSDSDLIIMDEPFTGLDEDNRLKTALYILDRLGERTLIFTTHREEDAVLLGGKIINDGKVICAKKC